MTMAVTNPTTGLVEKEFPEDTAEDVETKLALAQSAHEILRNESFAQRSVWMKASADLMESDVSTLAPMLVREMGKPITQAEGEVLKCVKSMRFYADNAEEFLADEKLNDPSTVNASAAFTCYQPLGVILAVMPWNYPLWQVMRFAAPALMAGNTGVLKHASNVPESALYLHTPLYSRRVPEGSFGHPHDRCKTCQLCHR